MALTPSYLGEESNVAEDVSTVATPSLASATDVARVAIVSIFDTGFAGTVSVSGGGLTWTEETAFTIDLQLSGFNPRTYVFTATGSPTSGAVTATFSAAADYPEISVYQVASDAGAVAYEGIAGEAELTLGAGNSYTVGASLTMTAGNALISAAHKPNLPADAWTARSGWTSLRQWLLLDGNVNSRIIVQGRGDEDTLTQAIATSDSNDQPAWIFALEFSEGAAAGETGEITEDADLGATFDGIVARLASLTEGAEFGVTLGTAITTDFPDFGVGLDETFADLLARLGTLDGGASLGATFDGQTVATGEITESAEVGATFDAILARLAAITEGADLDMSLGTAVTTAWPPFDAEFGDDYATTFARLGALLGAGSFGSAFDGVTITDTDRDFSAGSDLGAAFSAVLALLDALDAGVGLSDAYAVASARLGSTETSTDLAASFSALAALSQSLTGGASFGATFQNEDELTLSPAPRNALGPEITYRYLGRE